MPHLPDSPTVPTTLHLPRLICFHGGGTNSTIFKLQCRCLEKALRDTLRFVYVEAPYISFPGPDVLSVFKDMGPFKGWLRWRDEDELRDASNAVTRIEEAITIATEKDDKSGASGRVVGVLGFSQGAKLAASLLYTQQQLQEVAGESCVLPDARFGVLLAGRTPLVWLNADYKMPIGTVDAAAIATAPNDQLPPILPSQRLRAPTLHVHGLQDPGLPLHRNFLYNCCELESTRLMEWNGTHRVPIKTSDVRELVDNIIELAKNTGVL